MKNLFSLSRYVLLAAVYFLCVAMSVGTASAGTYVASAHGNSGAGVTGRATGYAVGNCAHCHDQHASRVAVTHTPFETLRGLEEEDLCEDCHDTGGPAADDIQIQINKAYGHTYLDDLGYSGRHTISTTLEYSTGASAFRAGNRHVECSDCHEPHYIGDTQGLHTEFTDGNLTSSSAPMQGVWGVEPTTEPATWLSPATGFTQTSKGAGGGATKEYQICFKCHSYYGLNDADGVTASTGPSGQFVTDQAMEFNYNLRSVHPVRFGLDDASANTSSLDANQMIAPWNTASRGTQTMWCSDCHGADDENPGTVAVGPHGSARLFMLKGTRQYWPRSSTNEKFSLNDINDVDQSGGANDYNGNAVVLSELFCLNCHGGFNNGAAGASTNSNDWVHNPHSDHDNRSYDFGSGAENVYCIVCHNVVPHGSARSSLIAYGNANGYGSDPAPYAEPTYNLISGFRKTEIKADYIRADCYINGGCAGEHATDDNATRAYDTNTIP